MSPEREQFSLENQGSVALNVSEVLSLGIGKAKGPSGGQTFSGGSIFLEERVINVFQVLYVP